MFFNTKKITVTVKPYGIVAGRIKGGSFTVPEGARLRKVLRKAGALGVDIPIVLMIDGSRVTPSHRLSDGDEIKILQIVGGG
jgi:sulfur carrier protein ThiS